jgi:hypothetical protein
MFRGHSHIVKLVMGNLAKKSFLASIYVRMRKSRGNTFGETRSGNSIHAGAHKESLTVEI